MYLLPYRRTVWSFFRLENEHLHNAFAFRRVKFIPLHFDACKHDDGDAKKPKHTACSIALHICAAGAVLAVLLFSAIWHSKPN
jgi:hypothetical protein